MASNTVAEGNRVNFVTNFILDDLCYCRHNYSSFSLVLINLHLFKLTVFFNFANTLQSQNIKFIFYNILKTSKYTACSLRRLKLSGIVKKEMIHLSG